MSNDGKAKTFEMDALFADLQMEPVSAVTVRPDGVTAGAPDPVVSAVSVRAPAVPTTRATDTMGAAVRDQVSSIRAIPGVLGLTIRPRGGLLVVDGAIDSRFDDRVAYFVHLAGLVGADLGLEGLREVAVTGGSRRLAALLMRDGTTVNVIGSHEADLAPVGRILNP
jgi:hypothetical protein